MLKLDKKRQLVLLLGLLLILTVSFFAVREINRVNAEKKARAIIENQNKKAECKSQKVASNECLFVGCNGFF